MGLAVIEKSAEAGGVTPTPVSELLWGDPGALSLTVSVAASVPTEVGLNVTEMLQDAPAASELPHIFEVTTNTDALAPPRETEVIVRVALPEFVSVKV